MNTRLQVEHPVTELVTGLDLVRLQLRIALGEPLPFVQADLALRGHAIEARLYAEDADHGFLPQIGTLRDCHFGHRDGVRLDSGVEVGDEVGIHYDPMLAKIITWGPTRAEANRTMMRALAHASVQGVVTNMGFLRQVVAHPAWQSGAISTHFIAEHQQALRTRFVDPVLAARIATVARAVSLDAARRLLPEVMLGWRNNRFADPAVAWLDPEDQPIVCAYRALARDRYTTRVGDATAEVVVLAATLPEWSLEIDGHLHKARVVTHGDTTWVHTGGADLRLEAAPRFASAETRADTGSCKAPMPGKVLAVKVAVGDVVEAGQPLLVLEAMKMEHTLEAPAAGTIAEVLVAPTELVQADQELVRIEPTSMP